MAGRALPFPVEERLTGFRITGEDVLDLEERRSAQPVVHLLAEEVREVLHLGIGEIGARVPALQRMAFLQERPELTAVAIAEHQDGAHEIRALVAPARLRPVTVDALARPHLAPAVSGRRVHHRLVARPGAREHATAAASRRRSTLPPAGRRPLRRLRGRDHRPGRHHHRDRQSFVIVALATVPARPLFASAFGGNRGEAEPWIL